jgi:hypothetical protein
MLLKQLRMTLADLRNIPRYIFRTMVGVAAVCGALSLWGLRGDGVLPGMSTLSDLDPYSISSVGCMDVGTTADARWKGLSPAMAILDRVNPTVAEWVRDKHENGLVVFDEECRIYSDPVPALAKYDAFRGRLVMSRELFGESDGTIAVTLCHEYRHSRQNFGKVCQYVLSYLLVRGGDSSVIENDAMIYEQEACNAVFGVERSNEKSLAAWVHLSQRQNETSRCNAAVSP